MATENEKEARKARLEHNRQLLPRAKSVATNVKAISLGTTAATAGTMSTKSPASEGIRNNNDDVPETNMKEDLVVAKTDMDKAKTSKDPEEHKGEELPKEEKKASKAEGNKGENQARSKKAEAKRKEGYNRFSPLLEIVEEAATEEREERVEETASKIEESQGGDESESETEQDDEATVEKPETKYSHEGMQLMQDLVTKTAEEAAAADKKREKRKRKKKSKAEKPNGIKEETFNGSYLSIAVLYLAFVCILIYSFIG